MNDPLDITPLVAPMRARVEVPGSKSITNRALVCAALATGESTLTRVLKSDDTHVMMEGLRALGFEITELAQQPTPIERFKVIGTGGKIPAIEADLFCGNSGTTMRFLTALATLGHGAYRLDGIERMRQRPIGDLLDALAQLGVSAVSEGGNGYPPVVVHANGLPGGTATIRGDISSQFLSGLLMAAPFAQSPVEIHIEGPLVSQPYVRMTLAVMRAFGVEVEASDRLDSFRIAAPEQYLSCDNFDIEPDASAASYFWAAAAVTGGDVTIDGLSAHSLQGDVTFVDCLKQMGCEVKRDAKSITVIGRTLRGIDVDMNAISDTVQTLAVVALFAEGETTIRKVAHIRHKETDRIAALAAELRKLGAEVDERDDGLTIRPAKLRAANIDTYNDHRMAMSFAIAGLRIAGVRINNPDCVEKTYPNFFEDLERAARSR
jgi:3-phosphoshikimate 1-carboxyvinyltransferase